MYRAVRARKLIGWFALAVLIAGGGMIVASYVISAVEQPRYEIAAEYLLGIEKRVYSPLLLAQITVKESDADTAMKKGFKALLDYISGNNSTKTKIPMTAPVLRKPTIDEGYWTIQFIMPRSFTLDTLPHPTNDQIEVVSQAQQTVMALRFSGNASAERIASYTRQLEETIQAEKLVTLSQPLAAFYNPPWVLPFMKRNEIMMVIGQE